MTPSVRELYRQLTACGLMSAEEVNSLRASLSPAELDAEISWKFLEDLAGEDRITAYQARLLYEGRPQGISLGRYTILEQLGQGGMGVVYKALHRRMRRVVAVKVLPVSLTSTPQAIERFQREVCAAARLSHPHIVSAYDADEADGVHFLVMEYIPGKDLARLVHDQGPLAVMDAVDVVLQAARGLDHAHSRGIIHRDIKPSNLLRDGKGTVKITDLGLARFAHHQEFTGNDATGDGLTGTGMMMGTIDFMAPEQALDSKCADHRADIYSLGCTLFFLLIGTAPYQGRTAIQRLWAHREQSIPSLPLLRSDVSPPLQSIFCRMVAKDPDERFGSVRELIAALDEFAQPTEKVLIPEPESDPSNKRQVRVADCCDTTLPRAAGPTSSIPRGASQPPAVDVPQDRAPARRSTNWRVLAGALGGIGAAAGFAVAGWILQMPSQPPPATHLEKTLRSDAVNLPAPDELAARWALGLGAHLEIETVNGRRTSIAAAGDLPQESFFMTKLSFVGIRTLSSDAQAGPGRVLFLELSGHTTTIDPSDWSFLPGLRRLEELRLDLTNAGETALEQVGQLVRLDTLSLGSTPISDSDLRHLANLHNLASLTLFRTSVSDVGLAYLANFPRLQQLNLNDTRVTDEGLSQLKGLRELRGLQLDRTAVTGSGFQHLHDLPRLWYLSLNGTPLSAAELPGLAGIKGLTTLELQETTLGDEAIEPLTRMAERLKLKQIDLRRTRISSAGMSRLESSLQGCRILADRPQTSSEIPE